MQIIRLPTTQLCRSCVPLLNVNEFTATKLSSRRCYEKVHGGHHKSIKEASCNDCVTGRRYQPMFLTIYRLAWSLFDSRQDYPEQYAHDSGISCGRFVGITRSDCPPEDRWKDSQMQGQFGLPRYEIRFLKDGRIPGSARTSIVASLATLRVPCRDPLVGDNGHSYSCLFYTDWVTCLTFGCGNTILERKALKTMTPDIVSSSRSFSIPPNNESSST
jgi:hypothetical protein